MRRKKEKAAPLDYGGGRRYGEALKSSPKADLRGEQRATIYASATGGSGGWGRRIDGLEGGRHLRLRETRGADRAPRTSAVPPQAVTWNLTSTPRSHP